MTAKRPDPRMYRKIYKQHFGPIPKDSENRSYEIHHKDGNPHNNHPDNLIALSLQEHYEVHFQQQDWYACLKIAGKMKQSPEKLSELARLSNEKRLVDGNHPFLKQRGESHPVHKRIADGTHNFLRKGFQKKVQQQRIAEGTHHWLSQHGESHPRYDSRTHEFCHTNGMSFIGTQHEFKRQNPRVPSGSLSRMMSGLPLKNGKFIRSILGWKYIGQVNQPIINDDA